jgi:hypothetical protein
LRRPDMGTQRVWRVLPMLAPVPPHHMRAAAGAGDDVTASACTSLPFGTVSVMVWWSRNFLFKYLDADRTKAGQVLATLRLAARGPARGLARAKLNHDASGRFEPLTSPTLPTYLVHDKAGIKFAFLNP